MIAVRTASRLAPRVWLAFAVLALGAGIASLRPAVAQETPVAVAVASADELAKLVGPIALYPDDLVAIVLPASTYPLQVVQAARFIEARKTDATLQPNEDWDDSVVALLNYPEVVELLNGDLDWTYDLGTAVVNQRADVLNAIQTFRDQAYAAGNLRSDDRQTVARDDGAISIKPADPEVIYVPYYEPERVVIYQPAPVYYYYPRRYPVYYYPYPAGYVFDTGFFWGVRSWYSIGWHSHYVHVYDWHYRSHPYFGWNYYDPWYSRNVYVNVNVNRYPDHVWQPRQRYGGRPVVRGHEGRVYTADTPRPPRTGGGMANSAYRSRSVETAQPAREPVARPQPRRGTLADVDRNDAARGTTGAAQPGSAAPGARTYRSGGGMSQALERQRAPVSEPARSVPTQRARQESTGMPQESARSASPPRAAPQASGDSGAGASAAPRSGGGMSQARRDDGGGSYRGSSSAGSYRGGGESGGGRSRSAAR